MLWECSECGETARERTQVCPGCGRVTCYTRFEDDHDAGQEVGSLRDYWVGLGAERGRPRVLAR